MWGVLVSRATWANLSISASEVPNGFSMTQGIRRLSSSIPLSTMCSTGMMHTHASGFSASNIWFMSVYGRRKPND
jgi:hypothetical protein